MSHTTAPGDSYGFFHTKYLEDQGYWMTPLMVIGHSVVSRSAGFLAIDQQMSYISQTLLSLIGHRVSAADPHSGCFQAVRACEGHTNRDSGRTVRISLGLMH